MKTIFLTISLLSAIMGYTAFQIEAYAMERVDAPCKQLRVVTKNIDTNKANAFKAAF
ncbi:MAG: hypothetical protein PHE67_05325 [Campylobacterales bacterium]|nr:hypothetical protein [Campylobacterales bacterium]